MPHTAGSLFNSERKYHTLHGVCLIAEGSASYYRKSVQYWKEVPRSTGSLFINGRKEVPLSTGNLFSSGRKCHLLHGVCLLQTRSATFFRESVQQSNLVPYSRRNPYNYGWKCNILQEICLIVGL